MMFTTTELWCHKQNEMDNKVCYLHIYILKPLKMSTTFLILSPSLIIHLILSFSPSLRILSLCLSPISFSLSSSHSINNYLSIHISISLSLVQSFSLHLTFSLSFFLDRFFTLCLSAFRLSICLPPLSLSMSATTISFCLLHCHPCLYPSPEIRINKTLQGNLWIQTPIWQLPLTRRTGGWLLIDWLNA